MTVPALLWRLLDETSPVIPAQWRLPLRYRILLLNKNVEPELAQLFELCRNFRCAVDIGSSHGFYSYKMSKRFSAVHAFDANPNADFDIRYYKKPNLKFYNYGLSDRRRTADLHIPVHAGIQYDGWGSTEPRALPFADSFASVPVKLQRLDDQDFVRTESVDLIKIDVEGCELQVLLGGMETLRRHKPVLIVENNAGQVDQVKSLLASEGYSCTDFSSFSGRDCPSPNLLFFPV